MPLTVAPLNLGTLTVDKSGLTLRKGLGTKVEAPCLAWVIQGGAYPVLVDSGPCDDPIWGTRHHNPFARSKDQSLGEALRRIGLTPEDIRLVVLSHLHWDHCYGNVWLPNARFLVQRAELAYAIAPFGCDAPIYETQLGTPHFMKTFDRFDVVDGEVEVMPGVRVVPLPGHTPGLQGVVVDTAEGPFAIVSDHMPLFENFDAMIPTGIIHSLERWYESARRIRALGARILPGHDIRILEKNIYP